MFYEQGRNLWREPVETIGVLELSSRACKLIVGNAVHLRCGFTWAEFYSNTVLTHFSRAILNDDLTIAYFEAKIWPLISVQMQYARERNVDLLVAVATAPMRQTHLQAELLKFMADQGLHVHILSSMEEVHATYAGFEWALEQERPESMIFVDQGGGSTEVSYILSGQIVETMAVDYGTLNSSVRFQSLLRAGLSVQDALHSVGSELQGATERAVQAWALDVSVPVLSAIGSAMTNLCKGMAREDRHGKSWSLDALVSYVQEQEAYLLSVSADVLCRQSETGYTPEQKCLQTYLGLCMLMVLMRSTGCETLMVNGVGMRFGIYSLLKDEAW